MRICGKCAYIYFGKDRACPKCEFGSYSAYYVCGTGRALWYLLTQIPYRKYLRGFICPICGKRASPKSRPDYRGRKWCMKCQDEYDGIDWDEIHERRNEL